MAIDVVQDNRFNKPSLVSLLELVSQQRYLTFDPSHVEIVSVSPYAGPELTVSAILEQALFTTQVHLRLSVPGSVPEELTIQYQRLLLPAFLYRQIALQQPLAMPALLTDRFETTIATVVEDTLAYIKAEYAVELTNDECTIMSSHETPNLDGTWNVTLSPNANHPVWVGAIALTAYNGVM